jgi:dihydroorotase
MTGLIGVRLGGLLAASLTGLASCLPRPEPPAPASSGAPPLATSVTSSAEPLPSVAPAAAHYDLIIRQGRVVDPASGRDGAFDVAIANGKVAKIAPGIDLSHADLVIDAAGLLVTPGFVDLHTHVFAGPDTKRFLAGSSLAVPPDEFAPSSCTTTVVDAGSSGHKSFARFRETIIARAATRVLAFVNIVGEGMRGGRFEQDLGDMDAEATSRVISANRETIVGIKVAHYAGPGFEPVDRAEEAARATGTRVMVDFGGHVPELSLEDLLLRRMRPGDLFTHAYAGVSGRTAIVEPSGALRPFVRAAHERGVLFDLGYGGASFVFSQAVPAIQQGLPPDTVSTDMHRRSHHGSMHDLVAVLSKLAALGVTVPDLVRRSTAAPADAIGRPDLGRLAEGASADIALLRLEAGRFSFVDVKGARVEGTERLSCELTLREGRVVWDRRGLAKARSTGTE